MITFTLTATFTQKDYFPLPVPFSGVDPDFAQLQESLEMAVKENNAIAAHNAACAQKLADLAEVPGIRLLRWIEAGAQFEVTAHTETALAEVYAALAEVQKTGAHHFARH